MSGTDIQACYLLNYSIKANWDINMSEFPLIYTFGMMFGTHSCIFDKFSGEVSDLKLSKNVKVMIIFSIKLIC